jgi:hypothetical protein
MTSTSGYTSRLRLLHFLSKNLSTGENRGDFANRKNNSCRARREFVVTSVSLLSPRIGIAFCRNQNQLSMEKFGEADFDRNVKIFSASTGWS